MNKKETEKKEITAFNSGDTVQVFVQIQEGGKTRIQRFQGTVIKKRGEGISQTFTVRKVTQGIGIERIFPLNSPTLEKIKVIKRGKTRRAKLYYLRARKGKKAKVKEAR
ncbi:50S ribosomal protein L19 [candidate division WOR-3 bacterium]|nr:50S ribosomal protein L19 [candidate division WOR-3 bacterium]TET75894.1 MAG: 50S ribosomal protein L19 [Candidatus Cloacimonadota bacterium]